MLIELFLFNYCFFYCFDYTPIILAYDLSLMKFSSLGNGMLDSPAWWLGDATRSPGIGES